MRNLVLILSALVVLAPTVMAHEAPEGEQTPEGAILIRVQDEAITVYEPDTPPVEQLIDVDPDVPEVPGAILPDHPCLPDYSACNDIVCPFQGGYGTLPVATPPDGIGIGVGLPARGMLPWFGPYRGVSISLDGGC